MTFKMKLKLCWVTTHFWAILLGRDTFSGNYGGSRHIFENFGNVIRPVGRVIYDRSLTSKLNLLEKELETHTSSLYTNKKVIRSGYDCHNQFNQEQRLEICGVKGKLATFKDTIVVHLHSKKPKVRENKRKIDGKWKSKRRKEERINKRARIIYCSLGGENYDINTQIDDLDEVDVQDVVFSSFDKVVLQHLIDEGIFRGPAYKLVLSFLDKSKSEYIKSVSREMPVVIDSTRAKKRLKRFEKQL